MHECQNETTSWMFLSADEAPEDLDLDDEDDDVKPTGNHEVGEAY